MLDILLLHGCVRVRPRDRPDPWGLQRGCHVQQPPEVSLTPSAPPLPTHPLHSRIQSLSLSAEPLTPSPQHLHRSRDPILLTPHTPRHVKAQILSQLFSVSPPRLPCRVVRASCYVLRAVCCVLHAVCCVRFPCRATMPGTFTLCPPCFWIDPYGPSAMRSGKACLTSCPRASCECFQSLSCR